MNKMMIRGLESRMQIMSVEQLDRGLAYAESCFETFRVIDGHVFDWLGHWQRLASGLAEFGLCFAPDQDEEVLFACLREAAKVGSDSLVRLTVSGGEAAWGLTHRSEEPKVYIQSMPYQQNEIPLFLRLERWPFALKKKIAKFSADYAETLRVLHGAADAHVLFEQGDTLLATATANILLYRDGGWFTPQADVGVLPGRVRNFLIQKGVVREAVCPLMWLSDCEAALVSNSGVFIQPIAYIAKVQRSEPMQVKHAAIQALMDILRQEKGVCL